MAIENAQSRPPETTIQDATEKASNPADVPLSPTIRSLGLVSLFTDIASEMVYPLTPFFLTGVLGAPAWTVGVIEGIAESTASLLKLYSGWLSDRVGRRKPFAVVGYGLGAVSKPLIAVASVWGHVLGARFIDRVGKGIRTAPRDALIAENCLPQQRGPMVSTAAWIPRAPYWGHCWATYSCNFTPPSTALCTRWLLSPVYWEF